MYSVSKQIIQHLNILTNKRRKMLQEQKQERKNEIKIISHRGLCSIFPQNTIQAIIAGLYCSDYVEFDVVLSADNEVIVIHDRGLNRLTNISEFPEYENRKKQEYLQNEDKSQKNWYVRDFNFQQLKKLRVIQPIKYRPQLPQVFKISKLEQIIEQSLKVSARPEGRLKSGLLIEIKQQMANRITQRDFALCDRIVQILRKYNLNTKNGCEKNNLLVTLQSFNVKLLEYLYDKCENSFVQLYSQQIQITQELLRKSYHVQVKGIGISQTHILSNFKAKKLKQLCEKLKYKIYYWTIRDDDEKVPFNCKTYAQVYELLKQKGVTNFITEYPDKCKGVLKIQSAQYKITKQQPTQIHARDGTQAVQEKEIESSQLQNELGR